MVLPFRLVTEEGSQRPGHRDLAPALHTASSTARRAVSPLGDGQAGRMNRTIDRERRRPVRKHLARVCAGATTRAPPEALQLTRHERIVPVQRLVHSRTLT